jgi:hypothetical protein
MNVTKADAEDNLAFALKVCWLLPKELCGTEWAERDLD